MFVVTVFFQVMFTLTGSAALEDLFLLGCGCSSKLCVELAPSGRIQGTVFDACGSAGMLQL